MKNLFKYAMMFIAILTSVVCFTACSSDDDDDSANFDFEKCIGSWVCTSSTDKVNGQTITNAVKGDQVSIKNDGTYWSSSDAISSGTYKLNGNVATISTQNGTTYIIKISFSGENMIWDGNGEYRGTQVQFHYVFEKK